MSTESRYEIKYVLTEPMYNKAMSWLFTVGRARERHPKRGIHGIYFDNAGYQSAVENLYGLASRAKYRLRWYTQTASHSNAGLNFEIKRRTGRVNRKLVCPLKSSRDLLCQTKFNNILNMVDVSEIQYGEEVLPAGLSPTLQVDYTRLYFEDASQVRFTIDTDIEFRMTPPDGFPYCCNPMKHPYAVLEVKFPVESIQNIQSKMASLNLTPKRHSKYLAGLAAFGIVTYF